MKLPVLGALPISTAGDSSWKFVAHNGLKRLKGYPWTSAKVPRYSNHPEWRLPSGPCFLRMLACPTGSS